MHLSNTEFLLSLCHVTETFGDKCMKYNTMTVTDQHVVFFQVSVYELIPNMIRL